MSHARKIHETIVKNSPPFKASTRDNTDDTIPNQITGATDENNDNILKIHGMHSNFFMSDQSIS